MIHAAVSGFTNLVSLQGVAQFKLAANLPAESTTTIAELAKTSGMHLDDAELIARNGVTRRLLLQHDDGKIGHSAASKAILEFPNLASFVEGTLAHMWGAAPFVVKAMEKWPGSQEPTQTAYNLAHTTDLSFFEYMAQHETVARKFAESMTLMQSSPALSVDFVLGYDWNLHASGTVVDVGGSQGSVAFKLAEAFPGMDIIVQDRPEIIALAPKTAYKNVQFQEHDFFAPQPVKDADVYFFRFILHDWPTKYCIKILQALIPALKRGARVILMDAIVPEPGVLSPFQERSIRDYDMVMKMLFNAKERTEIDWRKLIGDADEGGRFEVIHVLRPVRSQLGFLVIEWTG
ncbi:S-adenosyl-L-methionine-dependent methyltransferase [Cucurbitaria berberidis CBS 394.84]|uniref:S-adenosyl-L-methionine-dependent methyltransferase n=1 Tax=Cucurbitaria berberidis CBS 394.84 TaxID=1168544 RepID=A0A9P4GCQ6_9PLEO|nr:S-adenosyl-L-methionine-dependent methyltransferase [Cucurbitaria berberidis CBS 394.84]KAF1843483.1 S-adenosyl-L-methionine-dependent methyltransferase [Cucurbitaria berberidis CBS 394.84]